ncbi:MULTISPECIES: TMEM43 family protein [unclassified Desulfovibrio]|uniref:TMEM43 family protein n=1 Tax=unclassified Desulfovibrio TaxID=2593640 RepID=UPI000F5E15EC|nr:MULTISPECIES: TMEM43 family protein [unclassified Desulfovibrio]RRD70707.1 primosome assembly protein PriA [Desulfovibrio sp. OH1209_COT-279]RRD87109.1 primosome assembly protein PriA [Desulfovibrio sp. OH1186_COT-070]
MAYTETTTTSFFSRIGASFGGIGLGIVLFLAGTALLWWNEGDFVATGDALTEAQSVTQELGDITRLNPAMNGKLVHATGPTETKDVLVDPVFGVRVQGIRLLRNVEYYQWEEKSRTEKRQKLGGGEETVTTYTYEQGWQNSPVDSSRFKDVQGGYRNFVLVHLDDFESQAKNVAFGAYRLPESMIGSISGEEPLNVTLSGEALDKLDTQVRRTQKEVAPSAQQFSGTLFGGTDSQLPEGKVHVEGNTVFLGDSPAMPKIGDMRVTFRQVLPTNVSILAKVNGNTFESYHASNGKNISRLSMGTQSLENMYGAAHSSNATWTWVLRILGVILVISGCKMVVAPLSVIASVVPFLGDVVAAGTGIVCTFFGLAWSLLIISIAWLRFRPVVGGCMLLVAAVLIALLYVKGRKAKAAA